MQIIVFLLQILKKKILKHFLVQNRDCRSSLETPLWRGGSKKNPQPMFWIKTDIKKMLTHVCTSCSIEKVHCTRDIHYTELFNISKLQLNIRFVYMQKKSKYLTDIQISCDCFANLVADFCTTFVRVSCDFSCVVNCSRRF